MNFKTLSGLFLLVLFFANCTSYRRVVYLSDVQDSLPSNLSKVNTDYDSKIQINDILNIRITTLSPADVLLLNPTSGGGTGPNAVYGYLVDKNGEIRVPMIGPVKVVGLTRYDLENLITEKLREYTKDPVVSIKRGNVKMTVLGEVNKPGEVTPETERFTIFDAIGQADDLKVTAKRTNILILREQNGKRVIGRIDISSQNALKSPYFYLKPNDVIYVEPIKAGYVDRNQFITRYLGVGASLISVVLSLIYLLSKK